ncbi:MAG: phage tail tape measure protein, partial [Chloroflexota bacterium]
MAGEIAKLFVTIGGNISGLLTSLGVANASIAGFGAGLMSVGAGMNRYITQPVMKAGEEAVNTAKDFEAQMKIIQGLGRVAPEEMDAIAAAIRKAALAETSYGVGATEMAEGVAELLRGGKSVTDVFGNYNDVLWEGIDDQGPLQAAIDLTNASMLDMEKSAQTVIQGLATFGDEGVTAMDIVNGLTQTANASVSEVEDLIGAWGNAAPTLAMFGQDMGDVNTALALLSQYGVSGAEAGTALKRMFTNLMRPTDAVQDTLRDLGLDLYNVEGALKPLPQIVEEFSAKLGPMEENTDKWGAAWGAILDMNPKAATMALQELSFGNEDLTGVLFDLEQQQLAAAGAAGGMTDEMRNQNTLAIAGVYGLKALMPLMNAGKTGWDDMETSIAGQNTAAEIAAIRMEGLAGAQEILAKTMEEFMLTVGKPLIENVITPLVKGVIDLVTWF